MSESVYPNAYKEVVGWGNHEGKLLTVLYLDLHRENQTESEMYTGFSEFIGADSIWSPARTIPYAYCAKTLLENGQVHPTLAADGHIEGYRISTDGITNSVPAAGLLGEWSISNPDLSIQLLGQSRSTGQTRAPQHRLKVLSKLVESEDSILSIGEIADLDLDDTKRNDFMNIYSACNGLEAAGIVSVERVVVSNENTYSILSYDIPEASKSELSQAVEGVYAFLEQAKKRGARSFTYKECFNFIVDCLTTGGKTIDRPALRAQLSNALTNNKILPGIGRPQPGKGSTKVSLNAKSEEAIKDLIGILDFMEEGGPAFATKGRSYAREIQQNPSMKTALVDKAYLFSPAAKSQPVEVTKGQLVDILSGAEEPLTAPVITAVYKERYGRKLASHRVRAYLTELASNGSIQLDSQPADNSRTRKHNLYSANKQD